jgi:hypothetical protein
MTRPNKPPDEDIGRPGPWGANRYQKPGDKADRSVLTPPGTTPNPDTVSTTVTRKDYESADESAAGERTPEPPGGDAG